MTGFELRISDFGVNQPGMSATTAAQLLPENKKESQRHKLIIFILLAEHKL